MTYLLAVAVLALAGLSALLGAGALAGWKSALAESRGRGDARELAAQRTGEAALDADKIEAANASTKTAIAAEQKQEERGTALEKDLAHEEARPHGGLAGLSDIIAPAEAVPDPGARAGAGSSQR